jgi:signal transduction histidine kinase
MNWMGIPQQLARGIVRVARRVARSTNHASLRRTPLFVGLVVLIVSAPILRITYDRIIEARTSASWNQLRFDAQSRLLNATAKLGGGAEVDDGLLFVVQPRERTYTALGETDIEPPLFKLAEAADSTLRDDWFSQQGRSFSSFTRKYNDSTSLVALVDMGWWDPWLADQRSGVWRWMVLGWLMTGLAAAGAARLLLIPARRIVRERTDFLADAAHELRTPLAVIQASAGHALTRERSVGAYTEALTEIRSAAERASLGVTEMLDLARFDAGQAVPRLAPLRLDLLAEEVATSTRVEGCEVIAETGPSVLVQADMALLRQAVDNIVRNAAARSTRVMLRSSIDGGDGKIEVIDNGPGFAVEHLPYVFERYRRGDARGSLGLGLPIAASIVAAHGGRIDVVSPNAPQIDPDGPEITSRTAADGSGDEEIVKRPPVGATVTIRIPRTR